MDPITLALMGAGLGLQAYGAFKKTPQPGMPYIPTSNLPGTLESLGVYNQLRQGGLDLLARPAAPTEEQAALGPMLDYKLAQIREAKRRTQAGMQAEGERRGLPISDIMLGNLGGAETGAAMQEQGAYSDILQAALAMQQSRRQQQLQYNMGLLSDAQQMALARDEADRARFGGMAGMQGGYGAANYLAQQQQSGDISRLGGQLGGLGMYLYQNQGGGGTGYPGPQQPSSQQQWNYLNTGQPQTPYDQYLAGRLRY